jgi:hypothetical protein
LITYSSKTLKIMSISTKNDPSVTTPSTQSTHNPAHPDNENQDHTNKNGEKPQTAIDAVLDPEFVPTLDSAPVFRKVQSFSVLFGGLLGALALASLAGVDILQSGPQIAGVGALLVLALWWTGTVWIDWWEVVLGYWWLSMPVGGAAGLCLILMQENASGWDEVD